MHPNAGKALELKGFRTTSCSRSSATFFDGVEDEFQRKESRSAVSVNVADVFNTRAGRLSSLSSAKEDSTISIQSSPHGQFSVSGTNQGKLHQNYSIGRVLGFGSFSKVYEGTDKATGRTRAVKIVEGVHSTMVLKEGQLLKELWHRNANVPQYIDSWCENKKGVLITEYCEGTLQQLLDAKVKIGKAFTDSELLNICQQLLTTLSILHESGHAHLDCKPENVLVARRNFLSGPSRAMQLEGAREPASNEAKQDPPLTSFSSSQPQYSSNINASSKLPMDDSAEASVGLDFLLADFGIATKLETGFHPYDISTGDTRYMPLEYLSLQQSHSLLDKLDIFSFGMILLQLITCKLPYLP